MSVHRLALPIFLGFSKRASEIHGDPHFLLLFYHLLDLLHQCTKFHLQSVIGSFTKESP